MFKKKHVFKLSICFTIFIFTIFQASSYLHGQTGIESQELTEKLLGFNDPKEILVDGGLMKAYLSAFQLFKEDKKIPLDKKKLENYIVKVSKFPDFYEVSFFPKFKKGEVLINMGESSLGHLVKYRVNLDSFEATKIELKF